MARQSKGMAALEKRKHVLYRFYDASDVLLYVGITADFGSRVKGHQAEKHWSDLIVNVRLEHFATRSEALDAERVAIRDENPLYNVQGNRYVEIDPGPDDGWRQLADVVLFVANGEDLGRCSAALAEAAEAVELAKDDPDEQIGGVDPLLYAAESAIWDLGARESRLMSAVRHLLSVLPVHRVNRAMDVAKDINGDAGEAYVLADTVKALAIHVADLGLVNHPFGHEWRIAADRAMGSEGTRGDETVLAAQMMHLGDRSLRLDGMCAFTLEPRRPCARRAEYFVVVDNCPRCSEACAGHLEWCSSHIANEINRLSAGAHPVSYWQLTDAYVGDSTPLRIAHDGILARAREKWLVETTTPSDAKEVLDGA